MKEKRKLSPKRLIKSVSRDTSISCCKLYFLIDDLQSKLDELTAGKTLGAEALETARILSYVVVAADALDIAAEHLQKAEKILEK